jgi:hypothetical protein
VDHDLRSVRGEAAPARRADEAVEVDVGVQVLDAPAPAAHQVVVVGGPGVIQGRAPAGGDPAYEPRLLQRLERGVDRGEGDARQPFRDGTEDLLRGDVPIEPAKRVVDREPLGRGAEAAFPKRIRGSLLWCRVVGYAEILGDPN